MKIWIVSGDGEFLEAWEQGWQARPTAPLASVSAVTCFKELPEQAVVVVDGAEALSGMPGDLAMTIAVIAGEPMTDSASPQPLVRLKREAGWHHAAAALAEQALLRQQLSERLADAERQARETARYTAIGRFVANERHGLGNALTSVLGNSELVLMETEGQLRDEVRGQLETIHAMSLRIYEVLQRLSSLDMEMRVAERLASRGTQPTQARAATGN